MDGSTDISTEDHVLVYVRYFDHHTFIFNTVFLCAVRITKGNADSIFLVIRKVLAVMGLAEKKMIGFCSDGAAVLQGRLNGVAVQLKKSVLSCMISVHCCAHRAALVMTAASAQIAGLKKMDKVFRDVHALFHKSSSKKGAWERYARERNVTRIEFPLFTTTRWFSRAECAVVLAQNLHVLIPFLEEQIAEARHNNTKVWGKAKAILPKLKSYMNISVVFLMRDILVPTEILSKSLQSDKILPHDLMGEVERTKATLTAMCSTEGIDLNLAKNLNSFITYVSPDYVWSPSIPGKAGENVEIILSKKGWKNSALKSFAASFATIVNKELDLRFGEMGILGKFSIFNPANYVDMDIKTLESYGIAEFTEILKYFCGSQLRESDRLLDAKTNIGTIY